MSSRDKSVGSGGVGGSPLLPLVVGRLPEEAGIFVITPWLDLLSQWLIRTRREWLTVGSCLYQGI